MIMERHDHVMIPSSLNQKFAAHLEKKKLFKTAGMT